MNMYNSLKVFIPTNYFAVHLQPIQNNIEHKH